MFKKSLCVIFLIFVPCIVSAQSSSKSMNIEFIGATSAKHPVEAVQSIFTVGFDCTDPLGSCPKEDGKVYFENEGIDKEILSILIAHKMSGMPIKVFWDDSQKNSRGYCRITNVRAYK